jgi:hypothetical protein
MGIAASTDLIQISLPLFAMSGRWHAGSHLATESTVNWIRAFGVFFVLKGRPRYVIGNSESWHPRISCNYGSASCGP